MPKILIIGTNMMNVYHHRIELIKALISKGFEICIVATSSGEETILTELGCNFIPININNRGKNILADFKLLISLLRIIKHNQPNVVLTFYTKTNIYGGLACRLTHTEYIENITGLGTSFLNENLFTRLMRILYRHALKKSHIIFFQNRQNQSYFLKYNISKSKGYLLPGSGVSLQRFPLLEYPPETNIEFLFLSRILKEKGIEEYLNCAQVIKAEFINTVFHVVGPCEHEYSNIIQKMHNDGIIVYHGKLTDINPILAKTHCTVFPSYYPEGMANVLLESAASGRPIITTALPGCGETVEDGITGYIVKEKDYGDLIAKIRNFIRLPYEQKKTMGIAGRKKMEQEFDRNIVTNAYLTQINGILND